MNKQFNPGDRVQVENTDGNVVKGKVIKVHNETAGEFRISGMNRRLIEYWGNNGGQISRSESVIRVELDGGGQSYDYPESKVWPSLTQTSEDAGHIETNKEIPEGAVMVAFECNWCYQTFNAGEADPVEGDEGELYCSLDCLNNEYA